MRLRVKTNRESWRTAISFKNKQIGLAIAVYAMTVDQSNQIKIMTALGERQVSPIRAFERNKSQNKTESYLRGESLVRLKS